MIFHSIGVIYQKVKYHICIIESFNTLFQKTRHKDFQIERRVGVDGRVYQFLTL